MAYRIVDAKGPDFWNDLTPYGTRQAADKALADAQYWAREEAKREPSWASARLVVREVSLAGWTAGDGTGAEGYRVEDYFATDGSYRGPDEHGIEPVFEEKAS